MTVRAARSGQLSPKVPYTDWTYADSLRFSFFFIFLFCADLLNGASLS